MTRNSFWLPFRAAILSVFFCGAAQAVSLSATAVDLPDVVSGQDLWQFDYSLSGPLDLDNGVTLTYSYLDFAGLALTTPTPSLDNLLGDSDASLTFDGVLILTASPTALTGTDTVKFSLSFTKLTSSALNTQSFVSFDAFGDPLFDGGGSIPVTIGSPPPVPEPSTAALFVIGAFAVAGAQWRRSRAV